jgi:hypothetical protein
MAEDDFLQLITAKSWREQLATFLSGELTDEESKKYGAQAKAVRWFFDHDAQAGAEYYVEKGQPVPPRIVRALLDHKPKKRGRHARKTERAKQMASDIVCFLATEHLLLLPKPQSPSAISERVGKLMHLSRQSVDGGRARGAEFFHNLVRKS